MQGTELIIGAILPPFIDLINKFIKDEKIRYVVSLLACVIVGVVLNLNQLTAGDILASAAIVFASAQTVYKTYYKQSGIRSTLYGKLPE